MLTANSKTLDDDIGGRAYLPLPPREFSRDGVPADLDRSPLLRRLHDEHKARQARFKANGRPDPVRPVTPAPAPRIEPRSPRIKVETKVVIVSVIVTGFWGYHRLEPSFRAPPKIPVRSIQERVAKVLGVRIEDLLGRRRYPPFVFARQVAMWVTRYERPDLSLPEIGRLFADRDHTTVLHAIRKLDRLRAEGNLRLPTCLTENIPPHGGKENG